MHGIGSHKLCYFSLKALECSERTNAGAGLTLLCAFTEDHDEVLIVNFNKINRVWATSQSTLFSTLQKQCIQTARDI